MSSILADQTVAVPTHVPASLVRDFNFVETMIAGDLTDWWAQFHGAPDIFYTPRNGGHWVFTRYDDIAHGFETWADFSNNQPLTDTRLFLMAPTEYDPPLHTEFRLLVARFFAPKAVGPLEQRARSLTIELIDRFQDRGECDFIAEFAQMLPIGIFMDMVGLPDTDRLRLIGVADDLVRGATPEQSARGFKALHEYLAAAVAERRANPGPDVFSGVLQGRIDGGRLMTDTEATGMCMLLVLAGLDTVASMLGFIMIFLSRHPEHRRRLIDDPASIPSAVEELLRRFSVANMARTVAHDLVYRGIEMRTGDMVLLPTCLAAIDDRHYANPRAVDFDRADKRSLVFGRGAHQCVGSFLARTELRVFLEAWLARIPDFAIKAGAWPVVVPGQVNSVRALPLVWPTSKGP